jgi:hypothetical protein
LLRTACDQEPENCVRDCELSRAGEACRGAEGHVLECYASARDEDFVCSGEGFGATNRPKVEVCRDERDALLLCEFPLAAPCIDACRELESEFADAGAAPGDCPPLGVACETFCIDLAAFLRQLDEQAANALGVGGAATFGVGGTGALAVFECVVDRAESCYRGTGGAGSAGEGGAGGAGGAASLGDWGNVFSACQDDLL